MRTSGGINKKLPINSDEESFVAAGVGEISNLDLVKDLLKLLIILLNAVDMASEIIT